MNKPVHYFEVFSLVETSYRFDDFQSTRKKYFTDENKACIDFYDKIAYYTSENCKIEQTGLLSVLIKDDIDKWKYEISIEKDVIKIW